MPRDYQKSKRDKEKRALMVSFDGVLEGMEEPRRSVFKSIVEDYVEYCVWTSELKDDINSEGFLIDGRENPKLAIMHKMGSRKADYYAKISKALKDEIADEEENALDRFLNE